MCNSICNEDHPGTTLLLNVENKRVEIDSFRAIVRIKRFWKFNIETCIWNWNRISSGRDNLASGITLGSKKWVNRCLTKVMCKVYMKGINFNSQFWFIVQCHCVFIISQIGWPCQFHCLIRKRFSLMNLMVCKYCNWRITFITSPWK